MKNVFVILDTQTGEHDTDWHETRADAIAECGKRLLLAPRYTVVELTPADVTRIYAAE